MTAGLGIDLVFEPGAVEGVVIGDFADDGEHGIGRDRGADAGKTHGDLRHFVSHGGERNAIGLARGDAVGVGDADEQDVVGSERSVVEVEFLRVIVGKCERRFFFVFCRVDVAGGERLGGVGVEREPRAFGDAHAAGDGEATGLAAEVLGVNAFELDRGQLGAVDDLEVQVADAVVAADDIEVHVADDVFEFVAEELIVFAAGGCFADARERIAAAAAVGEAVADFDFVRDVVAVGAGVDEQFEVVVLGEFVGALAGGAWREADDFQVNAAGPRGLAESDSLRARSRRHRATGLRRRQAMRRARRLRQSIEREDGG